MSLRIDELRISLPAGCEARAATIARLVAEALADVPLAAGLRLDRLQVGPLALSAAATDRDLAHAIARGIRAALPGRAE
jgi:hypothetical protein